MERLVTLDGKAFTFDKWRRLIPDNDFGDKPEPLEFSCYQELVLVGDDSQKALAWNLCLLEQELRPTISRERLMLVRMALFTA